MNERRFPLLALTLLLGGCIEYFAEPPNLIPLPRSDGAAPDDATLIDAAPPRDARDDDTMDLDAVIADAAPTSTDAARVNTDATPDERIAAEDAAPDAPLGDDIAPPSCMPTAERCDAVDNDCDGVVDEPDPQLCPLPDLNAETAQRRCIDGVCRLGCVAGFHDLDGLYETGCEYVCRPTNGGVEACDDRDNDCDGDNDEDLAPPPADQQAGVCAGAVRVCVGQWVEPVYGERPGFEEPEVTCDGRDNDCDGRTDEGFGVVCCGPDDRGPPCNGCIGVARPDDGWVCIPAGGFTMGSPADEAGRDPDEGPERFVVISQPFLLQVTEMTQDTWERGWLPNPSHFRAGGAGGPCDGAESQECPVERVNWFEAARVANLVSGVLGLDPCYVLSGCNDLVPGQGYECAEALFAGPHCTGYRLPTEAEWEYAARAGTTTRFWSGDDDRDLDRVEWYGGNSERRTHPVGRKPANPWGLHDMHGNVFEWVHDWHAAYPALRAGELDIDPTGPVDPPAEQSRVLRGGMFELGADFARSAARFSAPPQGRVAWVGFRFARAAHRPQLDR